jgi:hypothetical protein
VLILLISPKPSPNNLSGASPELYFSYVHSALGPPDCPLVQPEHSNVTISTPKASAAHRG